MRKWRSYKQGRGFKETQIKLGQKTKTPAIIFLHLLQTLTKGIEASFSTSGFAGVNFFYGNKRNPKATHMTRSALEQLQPFFPITSGATYASILARVVLLEVLGEGAETKTMTFRLRSSWRRRFSGFRSWQYLFGCGRS